MESQTHPIVFPRGQALIDLKPTWWSIFSKPTVLALNGRAFPPERRGLSFFATAATENVDRLNESRRYFHRLWGITGDNCVGYMSNKDVEYYFPQFKHLTRQSGQPLADAALHRILEESTGAM